MKNEYMRAAIEEAFAGMQANDGGPFGAVIVCSGQILASAHNQVLGTLDPTAHAEIMAIRQASGKLRRFDLSDCELYATCEPCPMCLGAIFWARIPKLYYGCSRMDAAEIGFSDKDIYDAILEQNPARGGLKSTTLDRDSCLPLMEFWRNKSDKKLY